MTQATQDEGERELLARLLAAKAIASRTEGEFIPGELWGRKLPLADAILEWLHQRGYSRRTEATPEEGGLDDKAELVVIITKRWLEECGVYETANAILEAGFARRTEATPTTPDGRRLFAEQPALIDAQSGLTSIDAEVQAEIRTAWEAIITAHARAAEERATRAEKFAEEARNLWATVCDADKQRAGALARDCDIALFPATPEDAARIFARSLAEVRVEAEERAIEQCEAICAKYRNQIDGADSALLAIRALRGQSAAQRDDNG